MSTIPRRLLLRVRQTAVLRLPPPPPRDRHPAPTRTRLRIHRGRLTDEWLWQVIAPTGEWVDSGHSCTHAEALAVGLAALEQAAMTSPRS